ncbi:MAG: single-stranded-DNA-specific exonuclease RecJ, partial [Gammaproteobacteria bacterium]|nr:single-stranded-DNA-specific exonuclease RecJ [Gammaproteobacteria bacterium]
AGMTLKADDLKAFEVAFNQELRRCVDDEILQDVIHSDGELENEEFSLELAEVLRASGPWGQAFPEPIFDGDFKVVQQRVVAGKHLKLVLQPIGSGNTVDAIAFNHSDMAGDQLHAVFRLDVNEYMGRKTVQLMIEHIKQIPLPTE